MDEFSLYCIVDGDAFTMPLARDEYVLDVTTELHKNHQVFYLIFCRYSIKIAGALNDLIDNKKINSLSYRYTIIIILFHLLFKTIN